MVPENSCSQKSLCCDERWERRSGAGRTVFTASHQSQIATKTPLNTDSDIATEYEYETPKTIHQDDTTSLAGHATRCSYQVRDRFLPQNAATDCLRISREILLAPPSHRHSVFPSHCFMFGLCVSCIRAQLCTLRAQFCRPIRTSQTASLTSPGQRAIHTTRLNTALTIHMHTLVRYSSVLLPPSSLHSTSRRQFSSATTIFRFRHERAPSITR
jgi:hypothetical protein